MRELFKFIVKKQYLLATMPLKNCFFSGISTVMFFLHKKRSLITKIQPITVIILYVKRTKHFNVPSNMIIRISLYISLSLIIISFCFYFNFLFFITPLFLKIKKTQMAFTIYYFSVTTRFLWCRCLERRGDINKFLNG